jgi:hypothetical protein
MKEHTKQFVLATLHAKHEALQKQIAALRTELELTAAAGTQLELEQCED